MVSTAVSRRQRREAQRRTQRSHRRTLTVIISALTTIALFAGYCAADITDVAPGLLTLKPVAAPVFADPATAKSGGTVAGTFSTFRSEKRVISPHSAASTNCCPRKAWETIRR